MLWYRKVFSCSFSEVIFHISSFVFALIVHRAVRRGRVFTAFGKRSFCQDNPIIGSEYLSSKHIMMWRAALDLKWWHPRKKALGCGVIHLTVSRGVDKNVSGLKPIASNQWRQCIKKETFRKWQGQKDGKRVALALNMRQGNQLERQNRFLWLQPVVIMFHGWTPVRLCIEAFLCFRRMPCLHSGSETEFWNRR